MPHRYHLSNVAEVFSPALVFFPEIVRANVARVVELAGSPERLRPHVKTHKTREIVQFQLAAGVTKHKCATIAEAELLASAGVPDVLISYPLVGPNVGRLAALARLFPATAFSALVDCETGANGLATAAAESGRPIGFLVDIDVGQNRTGLLAGDSAMSLYATAAQLPGLVPQGLHAYDGHNGMESLADREAAARAGLAPVLAMRAELERRGFAVPRVVAGGTPTFSTYSKMLDVPGLECSPGTYVLHDHGYGTKFRELTGIEPAAVLVTRVVSRPTPTRVTFDLGTKAVASDPPAGKRLVLLDVPEYTAVAHNEEHFVIETPHADRFAPGDVAYAIPTHVCPTCALHREALVAENGRVIGAWPIAARDRKLTL